MIQALIVATSGRFTADAVWPVIEKHNNEGKRPQIEMWAESFTWSFCWPGGLIWFPSSTYRCCRKPVTTGVAHGYTLG